MLYDYQYTVVSLFLNVLLLILCYQRRSYASHSNKVFMSLLYSNILASVIDILTYYTISYPENFTLSICYVSNIVYLILYCIVAATFARYLSVLIAIPKVVRISRICYCILICIELILVLTTGLTHWIIYYTESSQYMHGKFFIVLYILPIVMIFSSLIMLIRRKELFNHFQRLTALTMFIIGILCAVFQISFPRVDVFHLTMTVIMLVLYIVFENPAYYTYHLTGCMNRNAFYEEAEHIFHAGNNLEMMLVCIMNRPLNHGIQELTAHTRLLDNSAEKLRSCFKRNAYCISDGKFIITLNHISQKEAVSLINAAFQTSTPYQISFRCRFFTLQDMAVSEDFLDHLIETIDMYSSEQLTTVHSLSDLVKQQHEYRLLEDKLTSASIHESFYIVYQPIYSLQHKHYISAEALIRFKGNDSEYISPELFIPIAEKCGAISEIGLYVFEQVCRFWSEKRPDQFGLKFVEINVSPVQFSERNMALRFIAIMEKYKISGKHINLEIIESELSTADQYFYENMNRLKDYGVSFSIDDYGSGFASADYLYRLPVDIVKIDKSILWNAVDDQDAMFVFRNILSMVKKLGKKIVVEGAENQQMVDMIMESGGDFIQGYFYSKPLDIPLFLGFLENSAETCRNTKTIQPY